MNKDREQRAMEMRVGGGRGGGGMYVCVRGGVCVGFVINLL